MENISVKEWLISIVVALLFLAVAIWLNPFFMERFSNNIREYKRALQINNNETQFVYAEKTKVGLVLAYGKLVSKENKSLPELSESYSVIEKITEKYTMHIRQVCTTVNKVTTCQPEVYYTWDTEKRETFQSENYYFLGLEFNYLNMSLPSPMNLPLSDKTISSDFIKKVKWNYLYEEDDFWIGVGDLRYYYKVIPIEYNASVFSNFSDGEKEKIKVYYDKSPLQVIDGLERSAKIFNFIYYSIWLLIGLGTYLYFAQTSMEIE